MYFIDLLCIYLIFYRFQDSSLTFGVIVESALLTLMSVAIRAKNNRDQYAYSVIFLNVLALLFTISPCMILLHALPIVI